MSARPNFSRLVLAGLVLLLSASHRIAFAEDGANGWLRYAPLNTPDRARVCADLPQSIVLLGHKSEDDPLLQSAASELQKGMSSICAKQFAIGSLRDSADAFVLGTRDEISTKLGGWKPSATTGAQGFSIVNINRAGHHYVIIAGTDSRGLLYGTFSLLSTLGRAVELPNKEYSETPVNAIRWVNQWDNPDGSIERGYAGRSIFFDSGHVRADIHRAGDYARLLASVGVNGCTVNNVNADPRLLTPEMIDELARIADQFRPWGVQLSLSVNFSSPQVIGKLNTFDPLDPQVIAWWRSVVDTIYAKIPDFAGFVVKADSEGKPGPSQYGRTPAQAANMLADALAPHGGLVLYRGFVYNQHLDWRDQKADRAKAGFDNFSHLDGAFRDNVVIQIKNGPIDFQVREPASPLFAALRKTNQAIELQVTQEYLGQQRHLVYLVPMWKTTLDTDMRAEDRATPVEEIVSGQSFHRSLGGFVGVANVGLDVNWLAHPLAMANLYGFGRLAWNPNISSAEIADAWTRLTFSNNATVDKTIDNMLLRSWNLYEDYTGPLGLGTLTDIIGTHYGPGIASAEGNGWGQWIRADHLGVGMDRTIATGTGYIGQYPPQLAAIYESVARCPDALLLFMHHVSYTHVLHSGKTVIQHIYDSHYDGAKGAEQLAIDWQTLHGLVDEDRYRRVLALQEYQAGHSIVWRDAVTRWFMQMSGIPDSFGRVGNYPDRIEAESMHLQGYEIADVVPWETASGSKAIQCKEEKCSASTIFGGEDGTYRLVIQYFDYHDGASRYIVQINGKPLDHWIANGTLPTNKMNGSTSTRHVIASVLLKHGDKVEIVGQPDGQEPAPLDYISITPAPGQHN